MTPLEIKAEIDAIAATAGPKAYVYLTISNGEDWTKTGSILASAYPHGIAKDKNRVVVRGDTFEDVFSKLRDGLEQALSSIRIDTIQKMALAILMIVAAEGGCSDARLRGEGFTQVEIDTYGDDACAEAARIGAGAPFTIERAALANAAE